MGKRDERLSAIARLRANRLGLSEEEVISSAPQRPRFLDAAASAAAESGYSAKQVLAHDDKRLAKAASYPGPECLTPTDIEEYVSSAMLSEEAVTHIDSCVHCEALLKALAPKESRVRQYMATARHYLSSDR